MMKKPTDKHIQFLQNELSEKLSETDWLTERNNIRRTNLSNWFDQASYDTVCKIEEHLQATGQEIIHTEVTDQYDGFYLKLWLSPQYVMGCFVKYDKKELTAKDSDILTDNFNEWQLNEISHEGPMEKWPHFSKHTEATIYGVNEPGRPTTMTLKEALKLYKLRLSGFTVIGCILTSMCNENNHQKI